MTHGFREFAIGGVLVAPFVPQAIIAFALFLMCRPVFRLSAFDGIFANPPLVGVCSFVVILALVMLLT